jgi:superfamily II DNA or RNA helicase
VSYALRDYQVRAEDAIRATYNSGIKRVVCVAPTGAGKTVLAAHIIERALVKACALGTAIWFCAHRKELIDQPSRKLDESGIDHGIVKAGHWRHRPEQPVQVCSVPSLRSRLDSPDLPTLPPGFIIIDEAHRALASSYTKILERYPEVPVLGLTASPWRLGGEGLGDLFQASVLVAEPAELRDQGWLVPVRGFAFDAPELRQGLRQLDCGGGDYKDSGLALLMGGSRIMGSVVDQWRKHAGPGSQRGGAQGLRTLVFAVNIEHSQKLVEQFCATGVAAEHVDGSMSDAQRESVLSRLRSGATRVVSNCALFSEGFDEPLIGCIVQARPSMSLMLAMQQWGRGRRPVCFDCGKACQWTAATCTCGSSNVKRAMLLLDHAGICVQHDLPDAPRDYSLTASVRVQRKQQGKPLISVATCRKCFAVFDSSLESCPACNSSNRAPKRYVRTAQGVAVPLDEVKKRVVAPHEFLRWLRQEQQAKGHKPAWIGIRFKCRFGRWPSKADWEPPKSPQQVYIPAGDTQADAVTPEGEQPSSAQVYAEAPHAA